MKDESKAGVTGSQTETTQDKLILKTEKVNQSEKPENSGLLEKENAELKRQIETMQKKLNSIPSDLESRKNYFDLKVKNIKRLDNLEQTTDRLKTYLNEISEIASTDEYTNEGYFLTIQKKKYSTPEDVFRFSNPSIIGEVILFTLQKIELKRKELIRSIES